MSGSTDDRGKSDRASRESDRASRESLRRSEVSLGSCPIQSGCHESVKSEEEEIDVKRNGELGGKRVTKDEETKCENEETKCENEETKREDEETKREDEEMKRSKPIEMKQMPPVDDLFADFMSEVNSLPSSSDKPKKIRVLPQFLFENSKGDVLITDEADGSTSTSVVCRDPVKIEFGKPDEECLRLTNRIFTNMFEVLQLPPHASEADIKKAYKQISLLIHPDKCKHPKAAEAFDVANKAYEELQKPEMKDKYKLVLVEAKKRVLKGIEKENKARRQRKEELLSTNDEDIQMELTEACDTLLKEVQENLEYADKCRKANEEWEQKAEEEVLEEARKEEDLKRKWAATRDNRVGDWKEFK